MKMKLTLALTAVGFLGGVCRGAAFAVKPGDDLEAAVAASRKIAGPREIVFAPGTYAVDRTLELDARDKGLTLRAEKDGTAILSGGHRLTDWTREEGTPFYLADVPEVRTCGAYYRLLVVDGHPAPRAEYPGGGVQLQNTGDWTVRWMNTVGNGWERQPTVEELTRMPYARGDSPAALDCASAEVRCFHSWNNSLVRVATNDAENAVLRFRTPMISPAGSFAQRGYIIYNTREGLKTPGQWQLDVPAGKIRYWPRAGEDMRRLSVVLPKTVTLIRIAGTEASPASGLNLLGLVFEATAPATRTAHFAGVGAEGVLDGEHVTDARFENLTFRTVGATGVSLLTADRCRVSGCSFTETGYCGLRLAGREDEIVSNVLRRTGTINTGSCGVSLSGSDIRFADNEVTDIPYSGVIFDGRAIVLERNRVRRVMTLMHDGAAFYAYCARACAMRGNDVRDIVQNGKGVGCSAFYFDEGSIDGLIENNRTDGVPKPTSNHMSRRLVVRNNLFCNRGETGVSFYRCRDSVFTNNVVRTDGEFRVRTPEALTVFRDNVREPYAALGEPSRGGARPLARGEPTPLRPRADEIVRADFLAVKPTFDGALDAVNWPGDWDDICRGTRLDSMENANVWLRAARDRANLYVAVRCAMFPHETVAGGHDPLASDNVTVLIGKRTFRAFADGTSDVRERYVGSLRPANPKRPGFPSLLFLLKIPFAELGFKEPPAPGTRLPFNCIARNGTYRETRHWESPRADGSLPGTLVLGADRPGEPVRPQRVVIDENGNLLADFGCRLKGDVRVCGMGPLWGRVTVKVGSWFEKDGTLHAECTQDFPFKGGEEDEFVLSRMSGVRYVWVEHTMLSDLNPSSICIDAGVAERYGE